jgi:hypothetical protein
MAAWMPGNGGQREKRVTVQLIAVLFVVHHAKRACLNCQMIRAAVLDPNLNPAVLKTRD